MTRPVAFLAKIELVAFEPLMDNADKKENYIKLVLNAIFKMAVLTRLMSLQKESAVPIGEIA
ncbi:MAG TPA: hypothetical protein VFF30_06930 [Nitrososphaerales archaeon]|nr:hypothetical protein [Nitrososphaerales archaeon]